MLPKRCFRLLLVALLAATGCAAQQSDWKNPASEWKTVGPENGAIIIIGGSPDEWACARFLEMAGGPDAKIVLIPTAGNVVDENNTGYVALKKLGAKNVTIVHTRDAKEADTDAFAAPLREADGIYISGGFQRRLAESYLHTKTHQALFDALNRGVVIAGNSAGASIQGSYLYGGGKDQKEGLGFVRDSAVGQHYIRRNRMGSVARILNNNPELIGFGVDEDAAALVRGNELEVIGMGAVAMYDNQSPEWKTPRKQIYLYPGDRYDLAERKVTHRAHPIPGDLWKDAHKKWVSPSADWATSGPVKGSLQLYGGQPTDAMIQDFLGTVGRNTPIVVVSSGIDADEAANRKVAEDMRRLGATDVTFLHTINENDANSEAYTLPVAKAGAVWLCDSQPAQQWRQADTYLHTLLHKRLFELLERNGTIAANGTGAGMTSARQFTAGYRWDEGYDLLKGVTVFAEPQDAKGKAALRKFAKANPDFTGIGLGEGTKLIVSGDEVSIGGSPVAVYDFVTEGEEVKPQARKVSDSFSLKR